MARPVDGRITDLRPQGLIRLEVSLSNPAPALGEEVFLFVDLLVPRRDIIVANRRYPYLPFQSIHVILPSLETAPQLEWARPLEKLIEQQAAPAGGRGIRVNNFTQEVLTEGETPDQKVDPEWYRRRLTFPVRVRATGRAQVSAARAFGELFVPSAGLAATRASGTSKVTAQAFVASSEPLTLGVFDLRSRQDRPQDFSGAVGLFRLSTTVSQTSVPVGAPFTLTLRLEGEGALSASTAPRLDARPEFAERFRVRPEGDRMNGATREFIYTLRALREDVKEVPAVQMSYYVPSSDHFETTASQPIALQVTPVPAMDPELPPALAGSGSPPADALSLLRDMGRGEELRLARRALPLVMVAVAAVLLVCVARRALPRFRHHQASRGAARQRRQHAASVRRTLRRGASPDEVRKAVGEFLRARFHLPPGEATPYETFTHLVRAGVSERLACDCANLLDDCATALYCPGGAAIDPGALASSARALVASLERRPSPIYRLLARSLRLRPARSPRASKAAGVPSR
jgi:hypothetical protein